MATSDERWMNRIEQDILEIKSCIKQLPDTLEKKYLTRSEWKASFTPIRNLVMTVGAVFLGALLVYLMGIVIGRPIK